MGMVKASTQPTAWQFLYVDGKLVGPVKTGETVRVYPDMDLADLASLHRKRFKTVEDMLATVKTLSPKAKRLEIRGDQTAVGDLLALFDSARTAAALARTPDKPHHFKETPKAGLGKRRTKQT